MRHRSFIWISIILIASILAPLGMLFPSQPVSAAINHVVIDEVYYSSNDWENSIFVELLNPTSSPVDFTGWTLETEYYNQVWRFNDVFILGAYQSVVIFPDATDEGDFKPSDVYNSYTPVIFETNSVEGDTDNPEVADLEDGGGNGDLRFNVTGDYILVKNGTGSLIDAFVWGTSSYENHISADAITVVGHSMHRIYTDVPNDTDDCSSDFIEDTAHPGDFYGHLIMTFPKQAPFPLIFALLALIGLVIIRKKQRNKRI